MPDELAYKLRVEDFDILEGFVNYAERTREENRRLNSEDEEGFREYYRKSRLRGYFLATYNIVIAASFGAVSALVIAEKFYGK